MRATGSKRKKYGIILAVAIITEGSCSFPEKSCYFILMQEYLYKGFYGTLSCLILMHNTTSVEFTSFLLSLSSFPIHLPYTSVYSTVWAPDRGFSTFASISLCSFTGPRLSQLQWGCGRIFPCLVCFLCCECHASSLWIHPSKPLGAGQ